MIGLSKRFSLPLIACLGLGFVLSGAPVRAAAPETGNELQKVEQGQPGTLSGLGLKDILANGLAFQGNVYYQIVGSQIRIRADGIYNTRSGGTSGTLKLRLWATTTRPSFGTTINGYVMAEYYLGQLQGGFHFSNVDSGFIALGRPPDGTYYVTMALDEYQSSGQYAYQDLATFPDLLTFGVPSPPPASCSADSRTLCLNSSRFRVQVSWRVPSTGASGAGTAVALSADTGYFWFFSSSNVELVVKVLDGRGVNNRYWVLFGALSDVEYTISVTDTVTGVVKTYNNPSGRMASVADIQAF